MFPGHVEILRIERRTQTAVVPEEDAEKDTWA